MSVYRREGQTQYSYDFKVKRRRFTGNTGATSEREAKRAEETLKLEAKALIEAEEKAGGGAMTIAQGLARYYEEVGAHHANKDHTLADLARIQDFFNAYGAGGNAPLASITTADILALVAWRRAHFRYGDAKYGLVSADTVNHTVTKFMRAMFTLARKVWGVTFAQEPNWREAYLKAPSERVREVYANEEVALKKAVRPDYWSVVCFARACGLRLSECLLKKSDVDLIDGKIRTIGKGAKDYHLPITSEMRAIIMSAMANPTDYVFTYKAGKSGVGYRMGDMRPIKPADLSQMWNRARAHGLPATLRFHDLRHDAATKTLRATGNLKLVSKMLNHSKLSTTAKYAHVMDDELLAGMEAAAALRKEIATKTATKTATPEAILLKKKGQANEQ